jgi:DNA-binding CsgD family transcriptional regulator
MGQMGRPGLSAAQKVELWHRWKKGQSLSEIGRALGKHAGSIHGVVSSHGGFSPVVRRRSRLALTLAEREEISRGMAANSSIRQIAAQLGRSPSTVKSHAMVAQTRIAPPRPTRRPGSELGARSPVDWPCTLRYSG